MVCYSSWILIMLTHSNLPSQDYMVNFEINNVKHFWFHNSHDSLVSSLNVLNEQKHKFKILLII